MAERVRQTDPGDRPGARGRASSPPELVAELKRESRALWVNWFCDERRTARIHLRPRGGVRRRLRGRQRGGGDGRYGRPPAHALPAAGLRSLGAPAHALPRPVPRQRRLRRHRHAAPRAAALRAGGVRARRLGPRLAADQAARLLPRRAAGPRRLHPGLRRRVGRGQRPVLGCGRRRETRAATGGCSSWPRSACRRWWKTVPTSTGISARAPRSWWRARAADFKVPARGGAAGSGLVGAGGRRRAAAGADASTPTCTGSRRCCGAVRVVEPQFA